MKRTFEERFFEKIEIIPFHSCWEWTASKKVDGYGQFKVGKRMLLAHRVSMTLHGKDPGHLSALHHCDNPGCVRPEHLYAGTQQQNIKDRVTRGRGNSGVHQVAKTHCPQGHEYTEENTYWFKYTYGRSCRTCRRVNDRKRNGG